MKKQIAKTIFINSFQKEIRNKTFWVLLVSSVLVMIAGRSFFKAISLQFNPTGLPQLDLYFYYFISSVWTGLMTALLGMNCLKSDTRYGLAEQILAFPIRSENYLFLRIAGTTLMVWFFHLILYFMMAAFLIHSPTFPINLSSILALLVTALSIFAVTTIASFWSILFGQISGFIVLFFSLALISFVNKNIGQLDFLYYIGHLVHWLLPHLGILAKISSDLVFEQKVSDDVRLWIEIPHFIFSMGFLFWGTHFIFKKRGFK